MEDEGRPLPAGWSRQYDHTQHHQFFVDTNTDPPRSIWHHPYDDDEYLATLDPSERKRVSGLHHPMPNQADMMAMSSDEDGDGHHPSKNQAPVGSSSKQQPTSSSKFGRKLKDKLTNSTHEQREAQRRQRAIEEQKAYERHQHIRQAMSRAIETGQPQLLGKDSDGKDLYIEPPQGLGRDGYPGQGYGPRGYNPYQSGPYATPNARYVRPNYGYGRPYGGGYGGGYGLPLAGGLLGGMVMGDMMFGGMGMGGGFGGGGL